MPNGIDKPESLSFPGKTARFIRNYLNLRNIIMFATPVSIAVLIFMLFNLSQTVEHLSRSIIRSTTDETVRELNTFFDPAVNSLKVAQQWGMASLLVDADPSKLNPRFIPLLKNYSQISSMLIANTSGSEYMLMREDSTWMNRIVSYKGTLQNIMRYRWKYDEKMNVTRSEKWVDTKKYDPRERPWFIGGLKCGYNKIAWTEPYIFFTTKDPGITISTNWSSGNESTYVIAFDIMLIDISAYTSKLVTGKHGKAFILTSNDKLIGLPGDVRFINNDSLKKYVLTDYKELNNNELSNAVDRWKAKAKSFDPFRYELGKKSWWAGFHAFNLGDNNVFYIGVIVPEEDFMAEVNKTRTIIIAAFTLVLILTLLVIRGYNQKRKAYALLEIQNAQIRKQKEEIEANRDEITKQRDKIEEQRNEITDSIKYSRRIQTAILPPDNIIKSLLPEHFVFYQPKDIVSGDFYWVLEQNRQILWAAVDCTGHGVPGAFMSIIGFKGLNSCAREYKLFHPGEILDKLNEIVAETFRQGGHEDVENVNESTIRDGMDIALCSLHKESGTLEFAGANNSLVLVRPSGIPLNVNAKDSTSDISNESFNLFEIKADRQPIGSYAGTHNFKNNIIKVLPGDSIYTFSDGFADQFGGETGKKFMNKQLKQQLLGLQAIPVEERKIIVAKTFLSWKGSYDQVDDVLVIGVSII
jgi:Cache domain./Stage II sporulation protein E (SpoIIE).